MENVGFMPETRTISVVDLFPFYGRQSLKDKRSNYRRIVSSIREVGLIEPLVVVEIEGRYYIKDGYLRWKALMDLGITKAECLVGTDKDAYTYNKRVNPLAPIQAHAMIERAVKQGVDPEKIAATLNVSRGWVKGMEKLVEGVSPEVVEKLKQRVVGKKFFTELKKVKPERQMEILNLTEASNDYTVEYMRALVLSTPVQFRVNGGSVSKKAETKMQDDLAGRLRILEEEFRKASISFRDNVFNLVKLCGYIRHLLRNTAVCSFLKASYPDILVEFEKIANDPSLNM